MAALTASLPTARGLRSLHILSAPRARALHAKRLHPAASAVDAAAPAAQWAGGEAAAALGPTFHEDGSFSLRVWAPLARGVELELVSDPAADGWTPEPSPAEDSGASEAEAPAAALRVPLLRSPADDTWALRLPPGCVRSGETLYRLAVVTSEGVAVKRRDPYARSCCPDSLWSVATDPSAYAWLSEQWTPPAFPEYIIYELHIGSFTEEGTLAAAAAKLPHLLALGVTAVQLLPLSEHSDAWGYSPRQLMALHPAYGTPDEMRAFVDACHGAGLAVIVDVVLHHGAPAGNALWNWDGPGPIFNCGGIFHEGAPDTPWGRAFAFWKREVREMATQAAALWLREYRCDGLRFDSANDLPRDYIQECNWRLHQEFPGRLLTAEVTPENPTSISELGYDSVWVHSGYFDIIQQHRALGRGHHGGGDWAEGWNIPRLRTAMCMHYGFEQPHQCIKYLLGRCAVLRRSRHYVMLTRPLQPRPVRRPARRAALRGLQGDRRPTPLRVRPVWRRAGRPARARLRPPLVFGQRGRRRHSHAVHGHGVGAARLVALGG